MTEQRQTKIKICGIRTPADVDALNRYRPDYAGFILSPGFRRSITLETAKRLRARLDPHIPAVGVFVDEPIAHIAAAVQCGAIQLVQLHGQENDAYIAALRAALTTARRPEALAAQAQIRLTAVHRPEALALQVQNEQPFVPPGDSAAPLAQDSAVPIIQAFRVRGAGDAAAALASPADLILLDSGAGTGRTFDWNLLQAFPRPYILAGGLKAQNLRQAITQLRPCAVDLSSGVERAGNKEPALIKEAIQVTRETNALSKIPAP